MTNQNYKWSTGRDCSRDTPSRPPNRLQAQLNLRVPTAATTYGRGRAKYHRQEGTRLGVSSLNCAPTRSPSKISYHRMIPHTYRCRRAKYPRSWAGMSTIGGVFPKLRTNEKSVPRQDLILAAGFLIFSPLRLQARYHRTTYLRAQTR